MTLYPRDRLYDEMAFLAYYLHWAPEQLLKMEHSERRNWCARVSEINRQLSGNRNERIDFK
ncbi:MAG: hypothetical protein LBM98_09035 [Oscillospiraceae bacterium]|nr:hypothetical protein [Oscillospiraceae bacterium]